MSVRSAARRRPVFGPFPFPVPLFCQAAPVGRAPRGATPARIIGDGAA